MPNTFETFMQEWAEKIARANMEELKSRVDFEVESIVDLTNRICDKHATLLYIQQGRA